MWPQEGGGGSATDCKSPLLFDQGLKRLSPADMLVEDAFHLPRSAVAGGGGRSPADIPAVPAWSPAAGAAAAAAAAAATIVRPVHGSGLQSSYALPHGKLKSQPARYYSGGLSVESGPAVDKGSASDDSAIHAFLEASQLTAAPSSAPSHASPHAPDDSSLLDASLLAACGGTSCSISPVPCMLVDSALKKSPMVIPGRRHSLCSATSSSSAPRFPSVPAFPGREGSPMPPTCSAELPVSDAGTPTLLACTPPVSIRRAPSRTPSPSDRDSVSARQSQLLRSQYNEQRSEHYQKEPRVGEPAGSSCEFAIEDVALMQDFERCNELLRRQGFPQVSSRLDHALPEISRSAPRAQLVVDAKALWGVCMELLTAYEERGKRLREAVLGTRADIRQTTDKRIEQLHRETARLEAELRELRCKLAEKPTPSQKREASGKSSSGAAGTAGVASERTSTDADTLSVASRAELQEMALRLRAAEATARQKEKDLERLKGRLEQHVADAARRKEREKGVLARPMKRRGGAAPAPARGEDPAMDAALAQQARADGLQAEVASLSKQVHVLSFRLEDSEERCRGLERQQQKQQLQPATDTQAAELLGSAEETVAELRRLRDLSTQDRGLLEETQARLAKEQDVHMEEVARLRGKLTETQRRCEEMENEKRRSHQPSAAELRWQREALRLQDELAEVRRLWRNTDTRGQMRRDKELRALGLDPKGLEQTASKTDLLSILLEECRIMKLGSVSDIVPTVRKIIEANELLPGFEAFAADVCSALAALDGSADARPADGDNAAWFEALLARLKDVCGELGDLRGRRGAEATEGRSADSSHASEDAWKAVCAELQLEEGATARDVTKRLADLRSGATVLRALLTRLRCREAEELPQALESVLHLCDERVAAQRIVEALQKLLHVREITEVLPALKDVLDMGALRKRAAQAKKVLAPGGT
eukprot:TRINITY_DN16089_c0_g1_i1.p1 TRINITY_DN16089_c0_g1~~TRINITY_DN16089_c0_g1_i1.p1  ORF type:complete len:943 (-),score=269.50 TRINITY_DN16089_c0_g1_i1:288-3116(-)